MLLTRLELFLRRWNLKPVQVALAAGYTRQHFRRLRMGESDATRRAMTSVIGVAARMTRKAVTADALFERGSAFLSGTGQQFSQMHAADRRALDALLRHHDNTGQLKLSDRLRDAGIASETALLHLVRAGRKRLESDPDSATTIYEAAIQMGLALRDSPRELVQSLQGQAYKGLAYVWRVLGKFEQALTALTRAREQFIDAGYCMDEAAHVDLARANILASMELWDDALPEAQSALQSFTMAGNARWAAKAELLEAVLLFEHGDTQEAHAKWMRLTKVLSRLREREDLARVWLNLGICETLRKRPADARRWLDQARAGFQSLNNTAELARTHWNIGTYHATFEDRHRALRSFTSGYRGFLGLRMWLEAGCVALDALDTMIDAGTPDDELTLFAGHTADTLARAGLAGLGAALDQLRRIAQHPDRQRVTRVVRTAIRDSKANCTEVSFGAVGEVG